MNHIPADRQERLYTKNGAPAKRIGDYGLMERHGWARIILSLPFLGLAGLTVMSISRGEPADSWPLLCGGLCVGMVFLLDGIRTLGMIPTHDVSAPAWYPEPGDVMENLQKIGPYRGDVDALPAGYRSPAGAISSFTQTTGQRNAGGENVEVTAFFDRNGVPLEVQFHVQDIPLLDRSGQWNFDDNGGTDIQ
jgi:hypothetical protein